MAQTVKRQPTMWETQVQSLGQEDLLEKEMATHCSTLAWKIPWTEEPGRLATVHGVSKNQTRLSNFTFIFTLIMLNWFTMHFRSTLSYFPVYSFY